MDFLKNGDSVAVVAVALFAPGAAVFVPSEKLMMTNQWDENGGCENDAVNLVMPSCYQHQGYVRWPTHLGSVAQDAGGCACDHGEDVAEVESCCCVCVGLDFPAGMRLTTMKLESQAQHLGLRCKTKLFKMKENAYGIKIRWLIWFQS